MIRNIFLACVSILANYAFSANEIYIYKNPHAPIEKRVDDLLSRMTLDEKIAQIRHLHSWNIFDSQGLNKKKLRDFCNGLSFGFYEGFPLSADACKENFYEIQKYFVENTRLGIPAFSVAESLHGVVHEGATIFPQNIALGSTFNPDLAYRKSMMISGELNTLGIKQVLAPCVDVARDLRWGRVEESYSEDPLLCSLMGEAEVKGYLDHGISPMLKHYGPHGNPLGGLNLASVECGVRDLYDVYLKPFDYIIKNTDVMAVMSSYNSWNREPNSSSHFLLTEILRNKYGFRGYVYSDWGVIDMLKSFHKTAENDFDAASQVLSAGLDVEASSSCFVSLKEKVENGLMDEEIINQSVRRVLRAKFELGLFEDPYMQKASYKLPLRNKSSVELSKQIADESVVLLKNENNILPLDLNKIKSIAVIGPNANQVQFGDYTWSKDNKDGITPLKGIKQKVENKVKVNYQKGCSIHSLDESGISMAVEAVKNSDVAVVFVGSSSTAFVRYSQEPSTCGEGIDLHDISLTGGQEKLIKEVYSVGKPVVVVLVSGKPFAIPWVKDNIPAILAQWYAGERAGESIADVLFGDVNPSGRLSFSFPKSTGHLPVYYNYLPTDKGYYKESGCYDKPGRDYVFSDPKCLWPFGYGLSYTNFKYTNAKVNKEYFNVYDTIKVDVDVENIGKVKGKEVVQLYVRDVVSKVMSPIKELKAFKKESLNPGEKKTIRLSVPIRELYSTDNWGNKYLEDGEFEIYIGQSSEELLFTLPVYIGVNEVKIQADNSYGDVLSHGNDMILTGVVRDVQATPIKDVKVQFGNKTVYTDKSGKYKITLKENSYVSFSKQNYRSEKLLVKKGASELNISMVRE